MFSLLIRLGNFLRSGCSTSVSFSAMGSQRRKIANFPVKFPVSRDLRGDGCDQHCVASQPVRRAEKISLITHKGPPSAAFCNWRSVSRLRIWPLSEGNAESLRRIFEIFPFLGDGGWRSVSICTVWPSLQWNVAKFSVLAADRSGTRTRLSGLPVEIARRSRRCWSPEWTWLVLQRRLSYGP